MSRGWEPLLEQVVRSRYPRLLSYATLLTGNRSDAQDVLQEAIVSAFSGRARFASEAEAEQYVRRAVATRSIDQARKRRTDRTAVGRLRGLREEVAHVESTALSRDVVAALAALPPRVRACVVLRHLEDLSVRETAQVLELSEGAVKRYTADGVAWLGARLGASTTSESVPVLPTEVHDA
jgi:RNA polymerase sigma factor (sigma-70 family)